MAAQDYIFVFTAIITLFSAIIAFASYRNSHLVRHNEVLSWSKQCINALRSLLFILERSIDKPSPTRMLELQQEISVLCEQGRLLFRNSRYKKGPLKDWGSHKAQAYQGIRPLILDFLIVGYDIAERWPREEESERRRLLHALEKANREFVSLAQSEVGRTKTASEAVKTPGSGSPLDELLKDL